MWNKNKIHLSVMTGTTAVHTHEPLCSKIMWNLEYICWIIHLFASGRQISQTSLLVIQKQTHTLYQDVGQKFHVHGHHAEIISYMDVVRMIDYDLLSDQLQMWMLNLQFAVAVGYLSSFPFSLCVNVTGCSCEIY
jgi:hypothetical protein